MPISGKFNATAIFTLKSDRRYRIYLTPHALYFICYGGQDITRLLAHQFGILGALVAMLFKGRQMKKLAKTLGRMDLTSPEELLPEHKNNFKLTPSDISEVSLEPNTILSAHLPHFGRWVFTQNHRDSFIFQLDTLDDMQTAYDLLPKILGGQLKIRVQWDEKKKKFVKKEDPFGLSA